MGSTSDNYFCSSFSCCRMILLALALVCVSGPALAQLTMIPTAYTVSLLPDPDNNIFSGQSRIAFTTTSNDMSQPPSAIWVNMASNLTLDENTVVVTNSSGSTLPVAEIKYDPVNSLIWIIFGDGADMKWSDEYHLSANFSGELNSDLEGLFTGFYNSTSKYVGMNLRPTSAARVFPCINDPQYRVTFTLQVLRPANYYSVSTAALNSSSEPDANNMVLDKFITNKPLCIHTLGLYLSPVSPVLAMGMMLYAPPGTPTSVPFLSNLLANITQQYGDFPQSSPPAIIILNDRFYTAISSCSIIFTSLEVYTDTMPSTIDGLSARIQLTEAFLRQYLEFDKTPESWTHMWLSESVGAFIATGLQPEPGWTDYMKVMYRLNDYDDCPIVNYGPLNNWDIEAIITNQTVRNKGLSVLTMWNDTFPEGLLGKTIKEYISLNKLQVTTEDFMNILIGNIKADTVYNVTAAIPLLPTWLEERGHPNVAISQLDDTFSLTQSSVYTTPIWPISVSYTMNGSWDWPNERQGLWFVQQASNITVPYSNAVYIFNLECAPYRVDYEDLWIDVIGALQYYFRPTPANNANYTLDRVRATIQDDAVALALKGIIPFSTAFEVLVTAQRNKLDWNSVSKACDLFTAKIGDVDDPVYAQFKIFASSLFSASFLRQVDLTNSTSNHEQQGVRAMLTPYLCDLDIGNCRQAAMELNQQLLKGNTSIIDASDIENVACYGARFSTVPLLDSLIAKYETSPSAWDRHLYTTAIGCLLDSDSVQRTLMLILNATTPFTLSDAKAIVLRLSKSVQNSPALVDFIADNSDTLQYVFGTDFMSYVIRNLAKFRVDLSKLSILTNATYELDPYVVDIINEAMDKVDASEAWWTAHKADLSAALPQVPTPPPTTAAPKTPPTSAPTSTPKPTPSSASSLHIFSLVIASAVLFTSFSL